jgi:Leucine-rich repeat (LRR) protein
MTKSMSTKLSDKIIEFNNKLEYAYLSSNHLQSFPSFCKDKDLNLECQLKVLEFNSNNLFASKIKI